MPEAYAASIERLRALSGTARDPQGHAFAVIAEYLRRDGKLEEAAEVVREGRERAPDFASGHLVAARVLRELGDTEGARGALGRLAELDRDNGLAAELTQKLDSADEEAALDWARAQGIGPPVEVEDEVVTVTLGELYFEQGALDRANDVARQLLEAEPGNAGAQALLGRVADELQQEKAAAAMAAAVDVATLAPEATPVEALRPDPVPVGSLAPEAIAIASLGPDGVPVSTLAPDPAPRPPAEPAPSEPDGPDEDPEDLDDFMSWLDDH